MGGKRDPIKGVLYFYSETGTEGGYWAFQDEEFIFPPKPGFSDVQWSYDGMHILKNGDYLKVFSKTNSRKIVWEGIINLIELPLFKESVFNLWIHSDQTGIERERWARWFTEEYPAELIITV